MQKHILFIHPVLPLHHTQLHQIIYSVQLGWLMFLKGIDHTGLSTEDRGSEWLHDWSQWHTRDFHAAVVAIMPGLHTLRMGSPFHEGAQMHIINGFVSLLCEIMLWTNQFAIHTGNSQSAGMKSVNVLWCTRAVLKCLCYIQSWHLFQSSLLADFNEIHLESRSS